VNRRVDQILAGFAEGDAISNAAVCLQSIVRASGAESEIYVDTEHVSPGMQGRGLPLHEYTGQAGDIVIHHYSIASPAIDTFLTSPATKVLVYHNITPSDYFRGYDDRVVGQLDEARARLAEVMSAVDAMWAVSNFNADELRSLGATNVEVFPLLFSAEQFDLEPDPEIFAKFTAPLTNLLFVGRIAPNKRIEDLIMAFAWYHRVINRQSRMLIVGSERSAPRYYLMLRMLANELELPNVCFERFASPEGLSAYYELADVFVTASDHEGYCLPLVESMHRQVPVIARSRGGMPEALGSGGLMYDDASPEELAQLIHLVLSEPGLKQGVLDSQAKRMQQIASRDAAGELKSLLAKLD
jgi:glycosyltransferase involved in cell wall biosynthesis